MKEGQSSRTYLVGGPGDELTDTIKIDLTSIPDHVREELAAATYRAVVDFLKKPGGREMLEERI